MAALAADLGVGLTPEESATTTAGRTQRADGTGMKDQAQITGAQEIQDAIRQILLQDWDPIGVRDVPAAQDEYDGYVGGVYRLLASAASPEAVAEHLRAIETERMGLRHSQAGDLLSVAHTLCRLSVRLKPE